MKKFPLEDLSMESLGQISSDLDMTIESSQTILNETIANSAIDRATMESFYKETQIPGDSNKNYPLVTYTNEMSSQNLKVSIEMMETAVGKFAGMSTQVMLLSSKVFAYNENLSGSNANWDKARSKIEEANQTAELTKSEIANKEEKLEGDQLSAFASRVETITVDLDEMVGGI